MALRQIYESGSVLHADETPVPMLKPGLGHTHRAYLWSYGTPQFDPMAAVVYDFADGRSGKHAQAFLNGWSGKLVCDESCRTDYIRARDDVAWFGAELGLCNYVSTSPRWQLPVR